MKIINVIPRGAVGIGFFVLTLLLVAGFHVVPREEISRVVSGLSSVSWYHLAALLALQVGTLLLTASQWRILLNSTGREIPWFAVVTRYLAGTLVESLTPSSKLGGESTRLVLFHRKFGVPFSELAAVTAVRAYCMTVTAVYLGAVALPRDWQIVSAALLLLPVPWVFRMIARARGIWLPSNRLVLVILASSAAIWIMYPVKIALVAHALGVSVSPAVAVAATVGAYLAGLIPLTPGGLVLYETGMAAAFVAAGVPASDAILITLTARLITFWWPLLLSVVSWATIRHAVPVHAQ